MSCRVEGREVPGDVDQGHAAPEQNQHLPPGILLRGCTDFAPLHAVGGYPRFGISGVWGSGSSGTRCKDTEYGHFMST